MSVSVDRTTLKNYTTAKIALLGDNHEDKNWLGRKIVGDTFHAVPREQQQIFG